MRVKKFCEIVLKVILFFMIWLIGVSVIPVPDIEILTGNDIFSGGWCKIEGSLMVLVVNIIFTTFILRLWKKKQNR